MDPKIEITEKNERRYFTTGEVRAAQVADKPIITGQATVFNQYADLGYFLEIIEPGFFDDCMEDDVRGLWNHNADIPLGRTTNKTLELSQTDSALEYKIIINPDDSEALAKYRKVERGDVSQSSFQFRVKNMSRGDAVDGDEWYTLGDKIVRRLKKGGCAELLDVSPVTFPGYPTTSANVRSKAEEVRKSASVTITNTEQAVPGGPEALKTRSNARKRALQLIEKTTP